MNPRITKQKATEIAIKLCEKKNAELKECQNKLSFFLTDCYTRKLPKDILSAFEKNPHFFKTSKSFYIIGGGIAKYVSESLIKYMPCNGDGITLTNSESDKFVKLRDIALDKKKEYKELVVEVENALLKCATYNKVKELFPEAVPFLPTVYPPPALNIDGIRKKLK